MRSNSSSMILPTTQSMPAELQGNLSNPAIPQHNQKHPLPVPSYCHFSVRSSKQPLSYPPASIQSSSLQHILQIVQRVSYLSHLSRLKHTHPHYLICSLSFSGKSRLNVLTLTERNPKEKKKVVENHKLLHISLRCGHKSYCKNSCSHNMKK